MNTKNILGWIIQVILGFLFVLAGGFKIAGSDQMVESFRQWGYGDTFRLLIGIIELGGGAALLVPRVVPLAALVLILIMVGAVLTHLYHGDGIPATIPALVLGGFLGGVVYIRMKGLYQWMGWNNKKD